MYVATLSDFDFAEIDSFRARLRKRADRADVNYITVVRSPGVPESGVSVVAQRPLGGYKEPTAGGYERLEWKEARDRLAIALALPLVGTSVESGPRIYPLTSSDGWSLPPSGLDVVRGDLLREVRDEIERRVAAVRGHQRPDGVAHRDDYTLVKGLTADVLDDFAAAAWSVDAPGRSVAKEAS